MAAWFGFGGAAAVDGDVFDHTMKDAEGSSVALSDLREQKALLIVNVASN